jgi:sugar phosphate isomerase/epimerase
MSFGAFLNFTNFDPEDWQRQRRDIDLLSDRGHIEAWLEWLPSTRDELEAVKASLSGERIIVHAPFIGLSIASPWKDLRTISIKRILECCKIAEAIGAELVTIHSGLIPVYEDLHAALDTVADSYEQIRDAAGTASVALENMFTGYGVCVNAGARTADLIYLSNIVPDIKFTFDIGHAIQNDDGYIEFLTNNAAMISNIHLHDATVGGRAHLRLGDGSLDLDGFLNACIVSKYGRFVSIETLTCDDTQSSWKSVQDRVSANYG